MKSRRRRISVIAIVVAVLLGLSLINLPIWAIAPGTAQEVAKLIQIKGTTPSKKSGHILMTDVSLGPVSPIQWALDKLDSNVQLVPSSAILGTTPPSSFIPTELDQMQQSKQAATVAALSYLGYNLHQIHGVLVAGIAKGAVVTGKLAPGDLITKVFSQSVTSASQFVTLISSYHPGQQISLTFIPAAQVANRSSSKSIEKTVRLALGARPGDKSKPFLGIDITTGVSYKSPVSVTISTPGIGGPSAGLAFTLGIIDRLKGGGLSKGKIIAATGTISPDGSVGDVGGVPQKAVAVERAGAQLFLVPPQEYKAALSKATPNLKVEAVSTLSQAVNDIRSFGASR